MTLVMNIMSLEAVPLYILIFYHEYHQNPKFTLNVIHLGGKILNKVFYLLEYNVMYR
jgi:hypothetical protein